MRLLSYNDMVLLIAVYGAICTTINLYLLGRKIKLDNQRRKADEAQRDAERIARENNRRELRASAEAIRLMYYDILGGKYEK